jgi:hypothetical protein
MMVNQLNTAELELAAGFQQFDAEQMQGCCAHVPEGREKTAMFELGQPD